MYRGPEIAQYARTLTLMAQYYRFTGDHALLLKHSLKLVDISKMLLARRRAAQQLPRADPSCAKRAAKHHPPKWCVCVCVCSSCFR